MALVHELSWSVSRRGTFESCRRRYYYDYYLSWGGWGRSAPPVRARVYRLKKMERLPMLAGKLLHDALERWFDARRHGREESAESISAFAVEGLRRGYKESRDGAWRSSPSKFVHLAEHHYRETVVDEASGSARDYGRRFVQRIESSVQHFFSDERLRTVREAQPADWLACESMGTFDFEGTKVFAVPDFAYRDPEGVVRVFDWKTGRERPEHRLQLAVYLLYAESVWGSDPERVRAVDAYLDQGELSEHEFDGAALEQVRADMRMSLEAMRALHFNADREEGDPERFPMVAEGSRECSSCNYRELCLRS